MVASAMALHAGVPMETVRKVIQEFAGVEHRIEYVCEKDGVAYYNDSKERIRMRPSKASRR